MEQRNLILDPVVSRPDPFLIWLHAAMQWRRLVVATALGVALAGIAIALWLPNRYVAAVVLMPPQTGGSSLTGAMMAQLGGGGVLASAGNAMGIKNPIDQQVALLKSRTVDDAMVERFHLQALYRRRYLSGARKAWESHAQAEGGIKDGLIHISVTDSDPARAAALANGWVDEYRRFSATLAITEASQRRLFYERQLAIAHEDLTRAEDEFKLTQQRTGVIDAEGQDRSMIASAAVLRGQLAAKQVQIRAMREFAADQNPDLQKAEQERAAIESQLAAMDAASDRKTGDLIAPKGTVTQASLDYLRAKREVMYRETIQDLLTRQYEGARVDEARQGALVQVVDAAIVPDRPSSHYRLYIAAAALLLALPVGLAAARLASGWIHLLAMKRCHNSWVATLEWVWERKHPSAGPAAAEVHFAVGAD